MTAYASAAWASGRLDGARIVLVGNWPPPFGGVSVHLQALRAATAREGAEVSVLDIGHERSLGRGITPARGMWPLGIGLVRAFSPGVGALLHLHTSGANPKSWSVVAGVGLLSRGRCPSIVVTFHSGHLTRWLRTTSRRMAAKVALGPYDRIICVSEEIRGGLIEAGIDDRRLAVLPAFGREGVVPGELPDEVGRFVSGRSAIVSSLIGAGRDYGERELLEAWARLDSGPGAGLVVAGPGTDHPEARRLVDRLGLKNVLLAGELDRPAALALLKASRLFVRPTWVDGDAVSVREALVLGIRVVATRTGTRPPGATLCEPGDIAALSDAMSAALVEAVNGAPAGQGADTIDGVEQVIGLYAEQLRRAGSASAKRRAHDDP